MIRKSLMWAGLTLGLGTAPIVGYINNDPGHDLAVGGEHEPAAGDVGDRGGHGARFQAATTPWVQQPVGVQAGDVVLAIQLPDGVQVGDVVLAAIADQRDPLTDADLADYGLAPGGDFEGALA